MDEKNKTKTTGNGMRVRRLNDGEITAVKKCKVMREEAGDGERDADHFR